MGGEALFRGIQGWSLGNGPADENAVHFQAEVVVESGRPVFLDDEAVLAGRLGGAFRLRRFAEVAFALVLGERTGHRIQFARLGSIRSRQVRTGLVNAEMDLSRTPPPEWAQAFDNPSDVPISMSMHPPERSGATIRIRYPDGQLAAYVANVDARIEAANLYFEQRVLPSLMAAEE